MMTYAVIGRNVETTLEVTLGQALAATASGDRVVFVDSASADRSTAIARELGVEVLTAPKGKGRAAALLFERQGRRDGALCLLDGDIEWSSRNIAVVLRDAWRTGDFGMLIGTFDWPGRRELSVSNSIHRRLVLALFPEQAEALDIRPLSGFRVLEPGLRLGSLPSGYGLEAHLNAQVSAIGARIGAVDLGIYEGPVVRRGAELAREIGAAILDVATSHGRITPTMRPAWNRWLAEVAEAFGAVPLDAVDVGPYEARLREASARPLPSPGVRRSSA